MKLCKNKIRYWHYPGFGQFNITAAEYGLINLDFIPPANNQPLLFPEPSENELLPAVPGNNMHWQVVQQLEEYLSGKRKNFDLPIGILITDSQKHILDSVKTIPYGQTATYDQIAKRLGNPGLKKRISPALMQNPLPFIIPCHRVVKNQQEIGNYIFGKKVKLRLLRLETLKKRMSEPIRN